MQLGRLELVELAELAAWSWSYRIAAVVAGRKCATAAPESAPTVVKPERSCATLRRVVEAIEKKRKANSRRWRRAEMVAVDVDVGVGAAVSAAVSVAAGGVDFAVGVDVDVGVAVGVVAVAVADSRQPAATGR